MGELIRIWYLRCVGILCCVNSEKTADLIYVAAEASNPQGNGS